MKTMRRNMVALTAVAAVGAAGTFAVSQAQADGGTTGNSADDPAPQVALIPPTGDRAIGATQLHLVDTDRADPWVPDEQRELMVTMWYPTDQDDGDVAPYMTPDESAMFLADNEVDVPPDTLSDIDTHAFADAKPSGHKGELPLVVLSPGFSKPRATLTGIAEDLASRGYLVAVIGHNYEAETSFPDGRTTGCQACGTGEYEKATRGRAVDVSFVLDELTDKHGPWKGGRLIDPDRIAMGGHSLGGATSFVALRTDDRIKAGLNVDGTMEAIDDIPSDRPFGMINHEMTELDQTWLDAWQLSTGWKRWLMVDGTEHASFTDIGLLSSQIGQPVGTLDPERAVDLTRSHVAAFFDLHLRGEEQPIWDDTSPDWPEVRFIEP